MRWGKVSSAPEAWTSRWLFCVVARQECYASYSYWIWLSRGWWCARKRYGWQKAYAVWGVTTEHSFIDLGHTRRSCRRWRTLSQIASKCGMAVWNGDHEINHHDSAQSFLSAPRIVRSGTMSLADLDLGSRFERVRNLT